ncbi:hypothetical protein H0A36_01975 [Endozoicomonas sp. SM1973]|uniref:TSP C-terminal domain-containing protein n=1 Tax=Spartinivicinus marinus TaxID=2994442 RepID=A0A853IBH4_9GAMM|nr:hypothetical protein [Spartinivicinus marinus]MCX4030000.1 hypothetical protein [Spartinivicinus marinus]NYZ64756.1 hypothetical protein [Spartinivicinus marinus]
MFKNKLIALFIAALPLCQVQAKLLDLSSWTPNAYNLGGQPVANWSLSADKTSVTQTINADPSMYLNNLNQTNYQLRGSWRTDDRNDDDFMGFVFGYQDARIFILWTGNPALKGIEVPQKKVLL